MRKPTQQRVRIGSSRLSRPQLLLAIAVRDRRKIHGSDAYSLLGLRMPTYFRPTFPSPARRLIVKGWLEVVDGNYLAATPKLLATKAPQGRIRGTVLHHNPDTLKQALRLTGVT